MPPSPSTKGLQLSALVGGFALLLNVAFWVLSAVYFADKRSSILAVDVDDAHILSVRIQFAIFSLTVAAGVVASLFVPKIVGHGIAILCALAALAGSYFAFSKSMPLALPVALGIAGMLFPLLVWRSLERSRAAWAFLLAMCFSLALILLFGAPKVRAQVGVGLWIAMIIPGLLAVAGTALVMVRRDYREV